MSKIYSISYDLNSPGQRYENLYKAIENYDYCKIMESHYLVYTNSNATQIYNKLKPCIDTNDSIFISEVTTDNTGWISNIACGWINKRS